MFGGGGFGTPATGSGFGTSNPMFGSGAGAAPGAGGFGGGATGGGFATSSFGTPGGGGFGAAPSTGGFGAPNTGGAFGASTGFGSPAASGFGAPASTGFGAGNTGFGARNPTSPGFGGGGFGAPTGTAFGSSGFGGAAGSNTFGGGPKYGSPAPSAGGFGSGGGFGAAPATGGFGGSAFGGTAPAGGFGASGGMGGAASGGMGGAAPGGVPGAEIHNAANENEIKREDRPGDTITAVRFTPNPDPMNQFFVVSSWDGSMRLFHLVPQGPPQPKLMTNCSAPVFDACFKSDGTTILAACADNTVQLWNLASSSCQTVGRHDGPVKSVHWIPEMNIAVTGSWDKTLRYWDLRQPNPAQVVQVKDKVHALAVKSKNMVVVCGGVAVPILIYDIMRSPQNYTREKTNTPGATNHPKLAIRSVAISTDNQYFCVGGIEGRCHINFFDDAKSKLNFTFRCHKTEETKGAQTMKYHNPINDINFHPKSNVMSTCGSDGTYCFWDVAEKSRLHQGPTVTTNLGQLSVKKCMFPGGDRPAPVLCSTFNAEGSVFAYGLGYDWNAGSQGNNAQAQLNAVVLHYVQPSDLKKKSKN